MESSSSFFSREPPRLDIIDSTQEMVREILANNSLEGENWPELKNIIKDEVHRFIFDKIKRNPMILPIILDV